MFDQLTGQVFTETYSERYRRDDLKWMCRRQRVLRPCPDPDLEPHHKTRGARSLQDCAIQCLLKNSDEITLEGITALPTGVAWQVWKQICERGLICFREWSIFNTVLCRRPTATMELLRFRQEIENPLSSLSTYTKPLISKQFEFITSLCITTNCLISDLVGLAELTNLGTLHVIKPVGQEVLDSYRVGDRLVRAWHEAALDGAFPVLRILRLWGHEDITSRSLNYLNSFRILAVYDVRDCGFDWHSDVKASELGWKACVNQDILDILEAACEEKLSITKPSQDGSSILGPSLGGKQLYDTAKVQFVSRTHMSALSVSQNTTASDSIALWADSMTWDFVTTTSFSKIGLLRNDLDLMRAGVPITTHALAGNELVSPVSIASICLGSLPNQHERPRLSQMRLFFIRTKTMSQKPYCPVVGDKGKSSSKDFERVADYNKTGLESTTKQRHETSSMRLKKKRKLGDVLSSFQ
ncbi:hypothetical protein F5884DRAFT_848836 [Xylogone sp. PMI_703]|nr:hypothetical protein F5884DRAFT_848836 [Xylogone sp. PMI_703]